MEEWLTVKDISEKMSVTPRIVREWITRKDDPLPAIDLGKSYRVKSTDLEEWLKKRSV